ncbi:MAG: hypothetical protein V2A66_04855 [Pseudomonadota bacterium]
MLQRKRIVVLAAAAAILCLPLRTVAKTTNRTCTDWPHAMTEYEASHMPGKTAIAVQPFSDYTKAGGDEWLSAGIRDYLADLMRSSRGLRVLAGLTAGAGAPDYTVSGKFEHIGQNLRIFVSTSEGASGRPVKQTEINTPYPDNQEFFTKLAEAAKEIMNLAKARADPRAFGSVERATSSTRAYESYSKGRQALESFRIEKMDVASTWFTDTKRIDYRSPLGYIGMIGVDAFLGIYHKGRQEPYGSYFQKAEDEMTQMGKLSGQPPAVPFWIGIEVSRKGRIENRFLTGNAAFSGGLMAEKAGNLKDAAAAFRRATDAVPEDAVSWYHLSLVLTGQGDTAASQKALGKAYAANACMGK